MRKYLKIFYKLNGLYLGIGALLFLANAIGQNINTPNKTGPMGLQVNTQTGNLFFARTDLFIPSRGLSLSVLFYYNSFNFNLSSPFGKGWSFGYNIRYQSDAEQNKTIIWGDGREDYYPYNSGSYSSPKGFFNALQEYEPGRLMLTEKNGTRFYFENTTHRRITKITEPNGNQLTFSYTDTLLTQIATSAGQSVSLAYTNGRLATLTDANESPARSWNYYYDNAGQLISVKDPLNHEYRYGYLINGPIKEVRDRNANVINIIYFSNYTVSELIGCNQRISFTYDEATLTTVVTDHMENGEDQVTKYKYKKSGESIWLVGMEGNCCGFKMDFEYDNEGNKIKETDANGNITRFTYDSWGNVLTITDALGQVYTYTYTSDFNFLKTMTDPKGFTSEITYDNQGNLLQIKEPGNRTFNATHAPNGDILSSTDPMGNVYTYQYDSYGNPAQVLGPNGYKAILAFDARGRLLSFTNSKNNQVSAEYDILNRLQKLTDPLNQQIDLQYDANGNLVKATNKNDEDVLITYDASDRAAILKDPVNQHDKFSYDAQGNILSYTNVMGQKTILKYDKHNRLTEAMNNIGEKLNLKYDNNGNIVSIWLPNGQQLSYQYDALDRLTNALDNEGSLVALTYDANGNIASIKNGTGAITTAVYDNLNRPIEITDPLGNTAFLEYDASSRIEKVTDLNGNSMSYTYDGRNRVTTAKDNLGTEIKVTYDANDNVSALTDQNGNTTSYQYDALERLIKTSYPDGKAIEYTYNNKDNITAAKLTDGSIITYTYDVLDRMVAKSLPDGRTFTYTYDGLGNILTATNEEGTVTFAYDNMNRVVSETFKGRTVAYNYNTAGRTQTTRYPNGTIVIMEYDTRNRLQAVRENGIPVAQYTYNNANQLLTRTLANGVTTNYQYDIANRLIGYSTGTLQQTQITYDKKGNKTSVIRGMNPAANEYFTYDAKYRIINYKRGPAGSPNLEHTYTYDALGNRTSATLNGVTTTYTSNNLNQLTKAQSGTTTQELVYDAIGNLIFDGKFHKTYDVEKRLVKDSASPAMVYTYQYDAFGRRTGKLSNGNSYEYDFAGMVPIGERINGQRHTQLLMSGYLAPLTITKSNETYYYLQNELGSIEALTSASGRLIERYIYDPYGNQKIYDSLGNLLAGSLVGNCFGFTGQVYDSATSSNGFYFRNYNPELGIFQQRDLIGYADGMGLYQYVGNNPANGVDIWGLEDCSDINRTEIGYSITLISNINKFGESPTINFLEKGDRAKIERLKNKANWADGKGKAKFRPSDLEFIETGKPPLNAEYGEFSEMVHNRRVKQANEYFNQAQKARIDASNIESSMKGRTNSLKGNINSLGKGLDALNVLSKAEAFASAFADGQSDGYHTQEILAGGDLAFTLVTMAPGLGQAIGTVDGLIELTTGKGITGHTADLGQYLGEISVGNYEEIDNASWKQAMESGKTRQWVQARARMQQRQRRRPECPQNGNNGGTRRPSPYPNDPQSGKVQILGSYDPNEIIGPVGQPDKRWVSVNDRLLYTINFENDTTATAPAKTVRITAPIYPKMDASTLELGSFGFNSLVFDIPPGTSAYYQRVDCRDSLGLFVDITAGFDVVNNQIFWLLQSIDPLTLQPSSEPLKGLLLLQDTANPNYGHGFVKFTIKPQTTAVTLDSILADAEIIFDQNEEIGTNIERNTIDAFAPTSQLETLPANSPVNIQLNWSGQDDPDGCGIRFYSLYVSTDGVNFNLVRSNITRTDTVITGQAGQHYYFFVLATDSVGNTEQLRLSAVQSTFVGDPLPATWLYFTGVNKGADNHLRWATANERDVKEYILERSPDASVFKHISKQKPNGGPGRQGDYQYLDEKVDNLKTDALYYRVKQVDNDGTFNYSSVVRIAIRREVVSRSIVYPNPTRNLLTVAVGTTDLIGTAAAIIDGRGRVIQQVVISSSNQVLNLDKFSPGMYYIRLKNGEVLKVIKQ